MAEQGGDLPISAMGSGSDHASFLHFAGIASANLGFGGESDTRGSYHPHYDTYELYTRYGERGLAYGATLAKVTGRMSLCLSEADLLPLRFTDMGKVIAEYVTEVQQLSKGSREATLSQHKVLDSDAYKLTADSLGPKVAPPARRSDCRTSTWHRWSRRPSA